MSVCLSVKLVRIGHTLMKIANVKNDVCRFLHFPSNGVIAKITIRELDLLFGGQHLKLYISETVRDSAKNCERHMLILTLAIE